MSVGDVLAWVKRLPKMAAREQQHADLAGLDADEGGDVYGEVIETLLDAVSEVRVLRVHVHKWNADDYCDLCGWDGRA